MDQAKAQFSTVKSPSGSNVTNNSTQASEHASLTEEPVLSDRKRKLEKRSPFRILSPNQIHVNQRSRRSRNDKRHIQSPLSSIQNHDQGADTSRLSFDTQMESTTKNKKMVENKQNVPNDNEKKTITSNDVSNSTEKKLLNQDLREGGISDMADQVEDQNDAPKEIGELHLKNSLDIFVTSRRGHDVAKSSPGDDLATTLSTIRNFDENVNQFNDKDQERSLKTAEHNDDIDITSIEFNMVQDLESENYKIKPPAKSMEMEIELPPQYQYPEIKSLGTDILKAFYNISISTSPMKTNDLGSTSSLLLFSHQVQLSWSKSCLLSLDEVILPALCQEEMNALKIQQAKDKRDQKKNKLLYLQSPSSYSPMTSANCPFLTHFEIIEECRKTLNLCTLSACNAAHKSRTEREEEIKSEIKEKRHREKLERMRLYEEKKRNY